MEEVVIDSDMTLEEAILGKPGMPVPQEVLDQQRIVDVEYYSFDKKLHKGQMVANEELVDDIRGAFELIKDIRFPIKSVVPIGDLKFMNDDDKSVFANNSSGFNYRNIARTNRLSNHAHGRAIDINPYTNPYIRDDYRFPEGVDYDPLAQGAIVRNDEVYKYFIERGWEWGGDWIDRKDYQHFQKPEA